MEPSAPPEGVTLSCSNLGYAIKGKGILRGINLLVEPGEILAVVGPSGAGKTTLLNCLAFRARAGNRTGTVALNGQPASFKAMRSVCNYVMTDGRMLPYLTVQETLMIAANLKLPFLSRADREKRVEEVMADLGLLRCRDTYIGGEWKKGISTGEKKRVCLALEMLANPSILILDEPTNGLDSTLACELFTVLQRLAAAGRTIVLSIHQPSSQIWGMLDQLLLLSHGQPVYCGAARGARDYFALHHYTCPKNYNPADFFLCLISDDPSSATAATSARGGDDDDVVRHTVATQNSNSLGGSSGAATSAEGGSQYELEMGCSAPPARSSPDTINRLIAAFEASKEHDVLKKRIDVVRNSMIPTDPAIATATEEGGHPMKGQHRGAILNPRESPKASVIRWSREVRTLSKRCFLNSIRNPIVCCVMLVVQALQGIILGGIFWHLTSDVANQKPFVVDTKAIVENPWAQLFMHGIDGKQPILDFLENGVDNRGSQPLVQLWKDREMWTTVAYDVLNCGAPKIDPLRYYPTFGVRPTKESTPLPPSGSTMDGMTPKGAAAAVITLSQALDHLALREDWSNLKPYPGDPLGFYTSLLVTQGRILITPWMVCAGYPAPFGAGTRRNLITIGDIGVTDALVDFLGSGGHDMMTATQEIFQQLRSCDHAACQWIDTKATDTYDLGKQGYTAAMAVVNILGALFFAVANLGFSSYDALLTFPQERALFNRESANGLYSPSSYFIAKNLADLPLQLFPNFVLSTIYYFMIGLGGTVQQYIVYFIVCSGVTFAAYGFGYLVSAASPRMEIAVLAAPFVLVIWLTIAGFFLRDTQIPAWIGWFSYFSFYKWGFFSLVTNQFRPGGYFGVLPNHVPLVMAGITDTRIWATTLILLALGFLYRVFAFFALKYTNRSVGLVN